MKGHISTVDFALFYSYSYEGSYDSYCGPMEYELDPSGLLQTYLTYDNAYLLTLAPLASHSDGTITHTLRARLVGWISVF